MVSSLAGGRACKQGREAEDLAVVAVLSLPAVQLPSSHGRHSKYYVGKKGVAGAAKLGSVNATC